MPHSSVRGAATAGATAALDEQRRGLNALLNNLPGMAYRWRSMDEGTRARIFEPFFALWACEP